MAIPVYKPQIRLACTRCRSYRFTPIKLDQGDCNCNPMIAEPQWVMVVGDRVYKSVTYHKDYVSYNEYLGERHTFNFDDFSIRMYKHNET